MIRKLLYNLFEIPFVFLVVNEYGRKTVIRRAVYNDSGWAAKYSWHWVMLLPKGKVLGNGEVLNWYSFCGLVDYYMGDKDEDEHAA